MGRCGNTAAKTVSLLRTQVIIVQHCCACFSLLQALLWFKSPPRYFARCTRRAAAEQVAALDTFMRELQKTLKSGVGSSGSANDLTWPSYRTPAAVELAPAGSTCTAAASLACLLVLNLQCPAASGPFSLTDYR